jgi:hypothetical protein
MPEVGHNVHFWKFASRINDMAKLLPLEASNNDPRIGGFVVEFPSGARKSAHWISDAPFQDTLDAAKQYTAKLIDSCLKQGLIDDLERTNIPSLVAAVQQIIMDWNERTRTRLHANAPTIQ